MQRGIEISRAYIRVNGYNSRAHRRRQIPRMRECVRVVRERGRLDPGSPILQVGCFCLREGVTEDIFLLSFIVIRL